MEAIIFYAIVSFVSLVSFYCFIKFIILSVINPYKVVHLNRNTSLNMRDKCKLTFILIGALIFMFGGFSNSFHIIAMPLNIIGAKFDAGEFICSISILFLVSTIWILTKFSNLSRHIISQKIDLIRQNEIERIIENGITHNSYQLLDTKNKIKKVRTHVNHFSNEYTEHEAELEALISVVALFSKINADIKHKIELSKMRNV